MNNSLERNITVPSILRFVFPSIVMMVIMSLYTVVDGTFVSRLIGTSAFSAVNIIYPLLSFTIGLGTMFGSGITAIISMKLGEGKEREANQNLTFINIFSAVLGVALSLLSLLFLKDIIYMLGADDSLYQLCYDYAFPLVFFYAANILQFQFQNLYVANGKPHIGLILTTVGGVTNIVLDYVFIAQCGMGIAGAAIATGIGYFIPALYGVVYFSLKRGGLHYTMPRFDGHVLCSTMANGSSEMVNNLSASVTTFLFNIIMMKLIGQDGVAAISILLYLDFILIAVSMGYSIGVAPLLSFNHGSGQREKIRKLFRISMCFCTAAGLVMAVSTVVFSHQLAGIFSPSGTAVFSLAVGGLTVYALSYLLKGINIFASAMFTAFGNGRVSAILSLMRSLVFLVPAVLLFSYLFGVTGVWAAAPAAEFLAFFFTVYFTLRYKNKYHYIKQKTK